MQEITKKKIILPVNEQCESSITTCSLIAHKKHFTFFLFYIWPSQLVTCTY